MEQNTLAAEIVDAELIRQILDGNLALFETLVRRYNPLLYKTGRSWNYNHEDTQDLMQDTFIDAYRGLQTFENRSAFKTWLVRIMLNNCSKKRQKSSYKNEIPAEMNEKYTPMFSHSSSPGPGEHLQHSELNAVLESALSRIPQTYRMVFSLREINGLNGPETAEALQINEGNVKVRLLRAKSLLRKEIEKSYSPAEIFEFNLVLCDRMVERVMGELNA